MSKERYIVHVDMDAFFAAIEQRDNPSLRGKPVVVGAAPKRGRGRGVVSTCSYEARRFGIHSAMPISHAYHRCPDAVFLPVDMEKYARVSEQMHAVLIKFTPDIEPVGIDEAFLDITKSYRIFGTPLETCMLIKSGIKKKTGLTASVGLAPTKMVAKIASDLDKPDGMVEVTRENLLEFLWPLNVEKIRGLGEKAKKLLNERGVYTIGDLARWDVKELAKLLGKNGEYFWQMSRGIDEGEVEAEAEAKSVSNETTFDADTSDREKIKSALLSLTEKVSSRLRSKGLKGRTLTLKIRLEGFHTYTRAVTLSVATNFVDIIYGEIKKLYSNFKTKGKRVRLVGVKVSALVSGHFPDSLFKDNLDEKKESIHTAVDKIKEKFGDEIIHRAGAL